MFHAGVLQPFVITERHSAGAADEVGDDVDFAGAQDFVGLGGRRRAGAFGDEADFESTGHLVRQLIFQRGGDEDVGLNVDKILG